MGKEFWGLGISHHNDDRFFCIHTELRGPEILLRDWTFLDGEPCGVERVDLSEENTH